MEIPPLHEFWKSPPAQDKGDPANLMFEAVGFSLTQWEILQSVIAGLFSIVVESHSGAAGRAYGSLTSHSSRLEILKSAAEIFCIVHKVSDDHKKDFNLLMSHLHEAGGKRNEIAHGHVVSYIFGTEELGCFLMPPHYNTRKIHAMRTQEEIERAIASTNKFPLSMEKYRYTKSDIHYFVDKFTLMRACAYKVANNLSSYLRIDTPPPPDTQLEPPAQSDEP